MFVRSESVPRFTALIGETEVHDDARLQEVSISMSSAKKRKSGIDALMDRLKEKKSQPTNEYGM